MIERILEAFTRPHDQVTAIDEIIQVIVGAPVIVLLVVIVWIVFYMVLRKS